MVLSHWSKLCWFHLFSGLACVARTAQNVKDLSNQNLTSFPHDNNNTIISLILNNNYIEEVDYLEPLPALNTIILDFNCLRAFPDLVNVSTTLELLSINNNRLRYVDRVHLDQLVALEKLFLRSNQLTAIPNVYIPNLNTLDIAHNKLVLFPLLSKLGGHLTKLDVSYNSLIRSIPSGRLFPLNYLRQLAANGVNLTEFPDLRPVRKTLEVLELKENQIREIDPGVVVQLTRLKSLVLDDNNIQSMPNMCMKSSSQIVDVSATNNPIRCDHTARWMKIAQEDGLVSLSLKCRYPPNLNGVKWSEIAMKNLTDPTGAMRASVFKGVDVKPLISVPRFVKPKKKVRSLLQCTMKCLETPTCVMFKYHHAQSLCRLADPYDGNFINFDQEPDWYIIY